MKEKEFNLSEKRINAKEFIESEYDNLQDYEVEEYFEYFIYAENNVKLFIKKLKEELCGNDKSFMSNWTRRKIDKLAGSKLIEKDWHKINEKVAIELAQEKN